MQQHLDLIEKLKREISELENQMVSMARAMISMQGIVDGLISIETVRMKDHYPDIRFFHRACSDIPETI